MVLSKKKQKIFVAISGGIDSSVSAYLLKQKGYDCTGVFMKNWSGEEWGISDECPWRKDQKMAEKVCKKLNIPFMTFNFEKEYRNKIINYFFSEYKKGRTPNPDILCNKEIKFGLFLKKAKLLRADKIATGHYAINKIDKNNIYHLFKGKDKSKDQSYFLANLNQEQLRNSLFPIGELQKSKVREIGKKAKLPNYKRPDSQGICFVGKINVREFIKQNLGEKEGNIVDIETNKTIGKHKGIWFYTIGQRHGLGIGGGIPYFVAKINQKSNTIYVAKENIDKFIKHKTIQLEKIYFISGIEPELPINCEVSVRYNHNPQKAILKNINKIFIVEFLKRERAPAIGQTAVIYIKKECIGSGIISKILD